MAKPKKEKTDRGLLRLMGQREKHFQQLLEMNWSRLQDEQIASRPWNGKVSPSNPKFTYSCCMEKLFEDIEAPLRFPIDVLINVNMGSALHHGLAEQVKNMPKLIWDKPTITDSKKAWYADKIWPEVPAYYQYKFDDGHVIDVTSGKADVVIRLKNNPAPIDWKFKWIDPDNWDDYPLTDESHETQVSIYGFGMDHHNFYPGHQIKQVGLTYFNMLIKPKEANWTREVWFDFDEARRLKTKLLLDHAAIALRAYHNKEQVKCEYPLCSHGHGYSIALDSDRDGQMYSFAPLTKRKRKDEVNPLTEFAGFENSFLKQSLERATA
jgi:hypothetical protein